MTRPAVLDDVRIIHETLRSLGRGEESLSWIGRLWILVLCFGPAVVMLAIWGSIGIWSPMVGAIVALSIGTYFALFLLSDRPLLNPLHAMILLFHYWFGVAGAVIMAYRLAKGPLSTFEYFYYAEPRPVLIVAAGLPLFALAARLTIVRWPETSWGGAGLLRLETAAFDWKTIRAYVTTGIFVVFTLIALRFTGLNVTTEENYLGGGTVSNPVLGAYAGLGGLAGVIGLQISIQKVLAEREAWRRNGKYVLLGIAATIGIGLMSGTKSGAINFAPPLIMYVISLRQRLPTVALATLALVYLVFLAPFVDNSRALAQVEGITTPQQRQELFQRELSRRVSSPEVVTDVNIDSPFRGMLNTSLAALVVGDDWNGRWGGVTIANGLSKVLPRFLNPNKGDSNEGNFFARELGATSYYNYDHNIVMSVPIEFAANYGAVAGVLAFGGLGLLCAAFSCWLLGQDRLATHPIAPWVLTIFMKMEANLGQWLDLIKTTPGLLIAMWLIMRYLRYRASLAPQRAPASETAPLPA